MKHLVTSILALWSLAFLGIAFAQNPCNTPGTVVETAGLSFNPTNLTIEAGETVVWVNTGGYHNVNFSASASGASWNNPETFVIPAVSGNASGVCIGSHTFTIPGVYDYDCSIGTHAISGMVGTVTVLAPPPPSNTVVDIIVNSDVHTTLETAVIAANLVETLSGDGPFTVFAPTDAAFAMLPAGTIEAVLADADLLTAILTYHVAAGTTMSTDLTDGMSVTTLNGESVDVTINTEGIFINDALVIVADVEADNGVVHVIDGVLLPPTSVTETHLASWGVFPNPAQGWIAVNGWMTSKGDLELLNAQGQAVVRWVSPDARMVIDGLTPGLYFIGNASMGWKRLVIR